MGFLSKLFKPKLEGQVPTPPMANPPVFANAYSQIAAGDSTGKKKKIGFDSTIKNANGAQGDLAQPAMLATPSLLG